MVSISVVFRVTFPALAPLETDLSISISTTSPSMISASSLMRTPKFKISAHLQKNSRSRKVSLLTDRFSESLLKSLSLAHFKTEDFRTCQHSKGCLFSKGFSHTHCYCGLASTRLSTNQNCSACNFSISDHIQDDTGCSSCFNLANHAL